MTERITQAIQSFVARYAVRPNTLILGFHDILELKHNERMWQDRDACAINGRIRVLGLDIIESKDDNTLRVAFVGEES